MKFTLNYKKTRELKEKLWVPRELNWGQDYHRSDLILCPERGYLRLTGVKPRPSNKLVAYSVMGTAGHDVIEKRFDMTEKQEVWFDVYNTFDVIWDRFAEIKTTRLSILRPSDIPELYQEQILSGMVCLKEVEAYLITLDIRNLSLLVWDALAERKEVNKFKHDLVGRKQVLQHAVKTRNDYWLTPHPNECPLCPYRYACKRWKRDEFQYV